MRVRCGFGADVILHRKIKSKMDIQEKLCQDELVQYIAKRHHLTPQEVVAGFLPSEDFSKLPSLEDNEKEMIRELIKRN